MEMATHSSVLAWRIPGMAEPGGLLSMGSHRVGHDWSDLAAAAAAAAAGVLSYIVLGQMTAKATTRLIWAPCQFPGKKKKNTALPISQILDLPLRILFTVGFSGGSEGKASAYNVGDAGSIPGLGRSTGEGNGNPHQYYCLENPVDSGAW